jgi:hypothetical protein
VAAEQGCDEEQAWRRFESASPRRARQLGRDEWRVRYWEPALAEAKLDRPRRRHPERRAAAPRAEHEHQAEQADIDAVRAGLRAAADEQIALTGRRPQFARSLKAALDALADVVVRRDGSISDRDWSEAAHLDRNDTKLNETIRYGLTKRN